MVRGLMMFGVATVAAVGIAFIPGEKPRSVYLGYITGMVAMLGLISAAVPAIRRGENE